VRPTPRLLKIRKVVVMLSIRAILVATDFSGCAEDAFRVARELARDYRARLIVLHVATPPPLVTPGELQRALQWPDGYRAELEGRLRQVYAADSRAGVEYRVQDGDPAVEILGVAQEARCNLIVMGTHGRTGLGRLLLGSVAEKVVRKAACPVLTVKVPLTSALASVAAMANRAPASPRSETRRAVASVLAVPFPNGQAVSEEAIRLYAYRKWETAGKPGGDGVTFWVEAERELSQAK
jgi:nucleotide-binding universal stress UspA family protein